MFFLQTQAGKVGRVPRPYCWETLLGRAGHSVCPGTPGLQASVKQTLGCFLVVAQESESMYPHIRFSLLKCPAEEVLIGLLQCGELMSEKTVADPLERCLPTSA